MQPQYEMMEALIKKRVEQAIRDRVFPGCVIGTWRQNGASTILPLGRLAHEYPQPLTERSIYDLASITKSIPVASLALTFMAEGKLSLADAVKQFIPELQNDYGATIEDLLRYRVTGPRMSTLPSFTFEEIRTAVFELGFNGPPQESIYSNLPAFLLGIVLERISGEILPALANRYFFEPLQMRDTAFFVHDIRRVAPTEVIQSGHSHVKKVIRGVVHDESARVFAEARRAVGHAGLFSTAPDLVKFLQAMLEGKLPQVVEGAQKGLGWETNREWMGDKRGPKTFGKTGFTGTGILCDIERGIGLVILSNRTYPQRPADNSVINAFRKDVADIVFG